MEPREFDIFDVAAIHARKESFKTFAERLGFEEWMYKESNDDVGTLGAENEDD